MSNNNEKLVKLVPPRAQASNPQGRAKSNVYYGKRAVQGCVNSVKITPKRPV